MSGCLRTASVKLLPLNPRVITRQPRSNGDTKILRISQFIEKNLSARELSAGNAHYSLPCVAAHNDCHNNDFYNLDALTKVNVYENWKESLHIRCKLELSDISKLKHHSQLSSAECLDKIERGKMHEKTLCDISYKNLSPDVSIENLPLANHLLFSSRPFDKSDGVSYCTPQSSDTQTDSSESSGNKATLEQLNAIYKVLQEDIPLVFAKVMDYRIYHPDLKFINNIQGGMTTVGLYHYAKQVAMVRLLGHIRFAYVKMDILNMAIRQEDSAVIVRWRISGVSGLKVMLMFWKYKLWRVREIVNEAESWYDGVSTFHVGSDGRINVHVVDKVVPDDENVTVAPKNLAAKLAILLGLVPRSQNIGDLTALIEALNNCNIRNSLKECLFSHCNKNAHAHLGLPLPKLKS